MYRQSDAVAAFAGRLGLKSLPAAVGLIVLLKELDADGMLDCMDTAFWASLGGKIKGIARDDLVSAYAEYTTRERRDKDRERQRKHRELSRKKCDTLSRPECDKIRDMSREMSRFERDTPPFPSSPAPFPLCPPSPPTPPVSPYNPPNPNPNTPSRSKKIGIDNNWQYSTRARAAAAQRLVNHMAETGCSCASALNLYDIVLEALEHRITPDQLLDWAQGDINAFAAKVAAHCLAGKKGDMP